MDELLRLKEELHPEEILLVVDAMTGQDAVNVAATFDEKLGITGTILTKLDGDTRAGAALSVREVTGRPIKFTGTGEKLTDLEPFHPDRMASRILGMGDGADTDRKGRGAVRRETGRAARKETRRKQLRARRSARSDEAGPQDGSFEQLLSMFPGAKKKMTDEETAEGEKQIIRTEAIINSMTYRERRKPSLINAARKKRIAAGSGTKVEDVNRLLRQFEQMQKMMKQLSGSGKQGRKMRQALSQMQSGGGMGGMPPIGGGMPF
jgi:signal recognition particle subunit SRP54